MWSCLACIVSVSINSFTVLVKYMYFSARPTEKARSLTTVGGDTELPVALDAAP